jgi:transcriptional regulator with XRE-family HTH domain
VRTVPNRIQLRRLQLGLTQEELAARLKISVTYLSKLENEKRPLNARMKFRIARALDTTVTDIFFD